MNAKISKIAKVAGVTGILLGATLLSGCNKITQEDVDKQIQDAIAQANADKQVELDNAYNNGVNSVDLTSDNQEAIDAYLAEKATEEESTATTVVDSYTLDNLKLGNSVVAVIDDGDLAKLQDTKISHDGEDYDVKETIELTSDLKIAYSGGPFSSKLAEIPYLETASKGSIVYSYTFEDIPDYTKISQDTPMNIKFLGENLEIVNVDLTNNKFTARTGTTAVLNGGESIVVSGKTVTLDAIGPGAIVVSVDGVKEVVKEGETEKVNGVDVSAIELFYVSSSTSAGLAEIVVGDKNLITVESGEAYIGEDEDKPTWVWNLDLVNGKIAVKHNKINNDLDEDIYKPGDSFALPNDYVKFTFEQEKVRIDAFEFSFGSEDVNGDNVADNILYITGSEFEDVNGDEYDELVFDGTQFKAYNPNTMSYDVVSSPILKESKLPLVYDAVTGELIVSDIKIKVDLVSKNIVSLTENSIDIINRDNDVLTVYGIVVESPRADTESSNDDSLTINVPKEQVEFKVSVQ